MGAPPALLFAPSDPLVRFAQGVLAHEVAALAATWRAGEALPTPEGIHQLRVGARRLRVALRLFRRVLPSKHVAHFRKELRRLGRSLGEARDLDVYAESFKAYAQALPSVQRVDFRGYELYLRRERAKARRRAAAAFSSPRTTALFAALERFTAEWPSASALRRRRASSIREAARRSIRSSAARVRRRGKGLDERSRPAELHKLRIKTKRLRYEVEFFAAVYPQLEATALACKSMQDLLGAHQDAYTATARLRSYAALLRKQGAPAGLPPALVRLRKSQQKLARTLRRSFKARWPEFAATIEAARRTVT